MTLKQVRMNELVVVVTVLAMGMLEIEALAHHV